MHASDGTVLTFGDGVPHPRSYGTFPRVLGHYVRELGVIGLEEAVRKMTSLPAQRAGLADRGLIRPGAVADLVIFDPERVLDVATFVKPHQYPVGIERVIVGGRTVFDGKSMTGERPGRVLRRTDRGVM
jgi:N-acyl-D-aspartate/D-glutamate deacylase